MATVESGLYNLGWLDQFAAGDTTAHRLDPRAKVVTTFVFLICVVSFGKYDLAGLAPFMLYPIVLASMSGMPGRELGKRLALAAPFALAVGVFNPLLDRTVVATLGPIELTAGWISYASVVARFLLTASAALLLVGTTGMTNVCAAVERLGVPDIFATQLLLLYRYIFVLAEEGMRLSRARSLRSFDRRGLGPSVYANMLGHLLLRTLERARRVFEAMQCRGFDGRIRVNRPLKMTGLDWAFMLGWSAAFVLFRTVNVSLLLGGAVTSIAS